MGDEGVDQIGGVEQQQDDGNAEAQPLVDQGDVHPGCGNPFGEVEHGRQQNCDDHQEQQCRQQTGAGLAESLSDPPDPPTKAEMPRNSNVVPMIEPVICAWTIRIARHRMKRASISSAAYQS